MTLSLLKLPNLDTTPPNGWRYEVPETGKTIGPFASWPQLRGILHDYYRSTGYPLPDGLYQKVQDQICQREQEYCGGEPTLTERIIGAVKAVNHTFHAAHRCLVTLVSNRAGGGEKPSMEVAEARAKTCVACPENKEIAGCTGCNMRSLNGLIEKLAGAKKTSVDSSLKFCAVCHCNNRAKIWTKHEAIWLHMRDSEKERLPETCWLKTEAPKVTT